ncbi:MAG TPA: VIT and VWA domain-containing protein [Agitococcus sp.]|nr:VIT and VWA domain-containing protein [Agitococcus sp.]
MFARLNYRYTIMRDLMVVYVFLMLVLMSCAAWVHADDSEAVQTESPYFFINSNDPETDRLPLKSTKVDVHIVGMIADVTIKQVYRNEGKRTIEARYVFPSSSQSAVYAMTVRLQDRLLTARLCEKQQAKQEYETAKSEGKTAALLEQQRPNVFEMNVANILPNDEVVVELRYTELLSPRDMLYSFVFPTVVGPRYNSPQSPAAAEKWVKNPTLPQGIASESRFNIKVTMDSPIPVQMVSSPSHSLRSDGLGSKHVDVMLGDNQIANNRDFVLRYRLAGEKIQSGLLLYRGKDENFFLGMVEPPKQVATAQIQPRDYIFVVDVSGSMHGHPLDITKQLLRNLIGGLRSTDTFNVMLFSGNSSMLAPQSLPATASNIQQAIDTIDQQQGGGSTEIVPALRKITELPKSPDVSRSVIVVTDGYVTVEDEVFKLIRQQLHQANVFAFGIGSSVNRVLIEGMARAGQGEPFIVTKPEEADEQAEHLRKMIQAPVLTQVTAKLTGVDAYDIQPTVLADVLSGRPVMVMGKWRSRRDKAAEASLVVTGRSTEGEYQQQVSAKSDNSEDNSALRLLWARQKIAELSDQEALEGNGSYKQAITDVALKYGLLSAYTSFVAVDEVVRNVNPEDSSTVTQPVPLPEGVSNLAVGSGIPSTPEPNLWLALALVFLMLVIMKKTYRRKII